MFARALKVLRCGRRSSAPARLVAVVCAVAILAAGFAHSVHQTNAPTQIVAMQADAGISNDLPDTPKKASIVVEHCFGCSAIALANPVQPFVSHLIAADLPTQRADKVRPRPLVVEIPPPKATI